MEIVDWKQLNKYEEVKLKLSAIPINLDSSECETFLRRRGIVRDPKPPRQFIILRASEEDEVNKQRAVFFAEIAKSMNQWLRKTSASELAGITHEADGRELPFDWKPLKWGQMCRTGSPDAREIQ